MTNNATIVAQVTAPGKSAVGILRVSGSQANIVAKKVLGLIPQARFATYSKFLGKNNKVLDHGISLWFPAPFSFTGENVLELQGHGNPLIMDSLIQRITSIYNVRLAKPGEFSERAFLNGKMDLIQAEAIDDLINSETEASISASLNSLKGDFSVYIKKLISVLIEFRTNVESSIDFSEEDISVDLDDLINIKFKQLHNKFIKINEIVSKGSILQEGRKIVIAGPPNAGKSSLFNFLSYRNRAIVTQIPGTTRDLLYENISMDGVSCELIDTAGLRDTNNEIECIGISRAWEAIKESDYILFVIDKTMSQLEQNKICSTFIKNISNSNVKITFVLNKNDLVKDQSKTKKIGNLLFFNISAQTGEGINTLRKHIIRTLMNKTKEGVFIARRRHVNQINLAYKEFLRAEKTWNMSKNIELLAESLNLINRFLGEITGQFTSNDLLKRIFSRFCIGK